MAKTNSGLVAYAKAQVGNPYWYGTYGQTASESLYKSQKSQYPSYYTASDFSSQYGKRVHDCSGLIKGYLWSSSSTATPVYKASQDLNASNMYAKGSSHGAISTFPMKAGQLVFKSDGTASAIHHVGVFGGDGFVYEAKGHQYGVVKTVYSAKDWQFWAQHCDITDDVDSGASSNASGASTGSSGKSTGVQIETAYSVDKEALTGSYKVTCTQLNMRAGAGKDKTIIKVLNNGDVVQCWGYYNEVDGTKWLYVQYGEIIGYCSEKYLDKV